ncbi:MAG TPA: magnesium-translocating P-type ATPase [Gaiellaceae bacterium]|nr:magnesium-translocating P-type ATPase [Gaiellaceae bacterium]
MESNVVPVVPNHGPNEVGSAEFLDAVSAAAMTPAEALRSLRADERGLSSDEAAKRLAVVGPNALRAHGARFWTVLARQFRSYLLLLLLAAAAVSIFVGEGTDAAIIFTIVGLSVALGFFNEYRSEQAVETLHSQIRRRATVERDGELTGLDITKLVPGDVVALHVGDVVPADLRLLECANLEIDEAVLTGESAVAAKTVAPVREPSSPLELPCIAFMGTVVHGGGGRGVVIQTGTRTAFGGIALKLGERHELTSFQRGLQDFSRMLATITGLLAGSILVLNVLLGRSFLESLLFALAISVGLTPQLLPAIVTVSLATGARRLAKRQVVVKRLVAIEDLGNVEVLFTDKTGTLTEGRTVFASALDANGDESRDVLELGLVASDSDGNALDQALLAAPQAGLLDGKAWARVAEAPFDHERQLGSALVESPHGRLLVAKGAPEAIAARCLQTPEGADATLDRLFDAGTRVVAVASRMADGLTSCTPAAERELELRGFLCFSDPPKHDAAVSLERLAGLGVEVKLITGDNGRVAEKVCKDLGMESRNTLTGSQLEAMSEAELRASLEQTSIFARVTPEQKSRVIRAQRALGSDVGFLGDGVNDALALHHADVGISVDTATDVAKDAADVVLVTKDLGILADGVSEGRRIFANTIKYVLMGTSSNFGNMFSAAGASLFLNFLPMLPTQILLNNLLYDVSELTIPTDRVDEELLARPSQWDIGFIRRFMALFGPISSLYDFATFAVLIYGFNAGESLFQSGWFVESLTSQTLVIFIIRTRRVPFFRSRPSRPLLLTTLACAAVGVLIPFSPVADALGFTPLPASLLAAIAAMVGTYLALVETGKYFFFKRPIHLRPLAIRRARRERRIHRRAARWSTRHPMRAGRATSGRRSNNKAPLSRASFDRR